MGRVYDTIDNATEQWLLKQPMFFVATAPNDLDGHVNLSPKGAAGAFRVVYVAKFEEAVYVLHAFRKKTRKTSQPDIKLAAERYKLIGGQS